MKADAPQALRIALGLVIAFVSCLVLFFALKIGAAMIPESAIHQSLLRSVEVLEKEGGDYHYLLGDEKTTRLDNFTTAIMLRICASERPSVMKEAFGDYSYIEQEAPGGQKQTFSLRAQLEGEESDTGTWDSYTRYWHGYTALLKPMLLFWDLTGIRVAMTVVSSALLLVIACSLARLRGVLAGLAFGLPFFLVNYLVAMMSLSHAMTFLIALAGALLMLVKETRRSRPAGIASLLVTFFVIGAVTSYLDLLCTPIITLGVPLTVFVYVGGLERLTCETCWHAVAILVGVVVCWVLGYGLLWVSKWLISSVVLGKNVSGNAWAAFLKRTGNAMSDAKGAATMTSPLVALNRNVGLLFPGWDLRCMGVFVVAALTVTAVMRRKRPHEVSVQTIVALLGIALLPCLWYALVPNHSYIHYWFTYRSLLVSLVACFLVIDVLVRAFMTKAGAGGVACDDEDCAAQGSSGTSI